MDNLGMPPLLPPEAERKISEVAICRPPSIHRLPRVAWRVKIGSYNKPSKMHLFMLSAARVGPLLFLAFVFQGATPIDEFLSCCPGTLFYISRTKPGLSSLQCAT
jgi:hypothetical protein